MTDKKKQVDSEELTARPLQSGVMQHWYCFSYVGKTDEGRECQASTYTGYEEKKITLLNIEANKVNAKVNKGAVLIACSYLGHMTREEFIAA